MRCLANEFSRCSFFPYLEFASFNGQIGPARIEGAHDDDLLGALADVDEAPGTGELRAMLLLINGAALKHSLSETAKMMRF